MNTGGDEIIVTPRTFFPGNFASFDSPGDAMVQRTCSALVTSNGAVSGATKTMTQIFEILIGKDAA